jgi:hypothetical protein
MPQLSHMDSELDELGLVGITTKGSKIHVMKHHSPTMEDKTK